MDHDRESDKNTTFSVINDTLEHGIIALRVALSILEVRKQESWDAVLDNLALQPIL
jgi:hypothetical protein